MERREVVRIALRTGALVVLSRLSGSEALADDPADLHGPSPLPLSA